MHKFKLVQKPSIPPAWRLCEKNLVFSPWICYTEKNARQPGKDTQGEPTWKKQNLFAAGSGGSALERR